MMLFKEQNQVPGSREGPWISLSPAVVTGVLLFLCPRWSPRAGFGVAALAPQPQLVQQQLSTGDGVSALLMLAQVRGEQYF